MSVARLLLVRADRIGDLMHVTPLLRALHLQHPGVAVDVLARAPATAVLAGSPHLRRVLDARDDDARLAAELAVGGYDAVAHLFADRRLIALCAAIPRSVRKGWLPWPGRQRRVVVRRSRSHHSEALYNAELLRSWFPDLRIEPRPSIFPDAAARDQAAALMPVPRPLINPGSGHPAGAWPAERFAATVRQLAPRLGLPLVVWGPGEEALARDVATAGGGELAPPTGLLGLAALAERCAVMVSNDTGPMHIGAAAGAPLVVVWDGSRAIRPRRWGHHFRADIVNLDPYDGSDDAPAARSRRLATIGVEQVVAAACAQARRTAAVPSAGVG